MKSVMYNDTGQMTLKEVSVMSGAGEERVRGCRGFLFRIMATSLLLGVVLTAYLGVLWAYTVDNGSDTQTSFDRMLPFRPGWVWLYITPFVAGPLLTGLMNRHTYFWYMARAVALSSVSLVLFIVIPTKVSRPDISSLSSDFTGDVFRGITAIAGFSGNAAPSLHVSLTLLLAIGMSKDYRKLSAVWFGFSGAVWLSTLLTCQHHLIDVGTGLILGACFAVPIRSRGVPGRTGKVKRERPAFQNTIPESLHLNRRLTYAHLTLSVSPYNRPVAADVVPARISPCSRQHLRPLQCPTL
jgi:hypothetical protein